MSNRPREMHSLPKMRYGEVHSQRLHDGQGAADKNRELNMIYFDNASTTFPKPECVYEALDSAYRTQGVSAGRGQYQAAAAAGKMIADARKQIKALLGCNAEYEAVFTSSATESLNTLLHGLSYEGIKNVYITPFEHNSVLSMTSPTSPITTVARKTTRPFTTSTSLRISHAG